jgi:ferredoxin
MPKLKTHSMTTLSGGIKNLFGTIPGLQKPEMHYRFPDIDDFCGMLLELAQVVKPNITIIDGITAMEGNGPNGGDPRHLGVTLASRNIFAQDYIAAGLMGISPESVPMIRLAQERGLFSPDDIGLAGDNFSPAQPPFKLPDAADIDFLTGFPDFLRRPLKKIMDGILRPMPKLNKSKCVGCGKCAESCPPQIIKLENGKAHFQKKGCISCFCCQEMCPAHAIDVKRNVK